MNIVFKLVILFCMVFCHITDDYYMQGILSQMKQRKWWEKNAPHPMYRNDYKMALFEHAFSWSFTVTVPLLVTAMCTANTALMRFVLGAYLVNTPVHAIIDDLKANQLKISLVLDQTVHFTQILATWGVAVLMM